MKYIVLLIVIFLFSFLLNYLLNTNKEKTPRLLHYSTNWNYKMQTELHKIYKAKKMKIVMLGDSHTYRVCWNELLSRKDVLNRGIDGDITEGFLHRLDSIIEKNKPKYIFILGGYNDFRKGYDVNNVFSNMKEMINKIQAKNIKVVIQSTFYSAHSKYKIKISELNQLLKEHCQKKDIYFLNLNDELTKDNVLKSKYTYDNVHLNAKGYKVWGDKILNFLN